MSAPCNLAKNLSKSFASLFNTVTELQVSIEELKARLFALEEKERQRAREDHDRELALDFKDAEGLGDI